MSSKYQPYIDYWKKRSRQEENERLALFNYAQKKASEIVDFIVENYDPKRVWLFGSVLNVDDFRVYSDIDVAVEGVEGLQFYNMVSMADRLEKIDIDVCNIDDLQNFRKEQIFKKGKLVYEK